MFRATTCACLVFLAAASIVDDEALVKQYVAAHGNQTYRAPAGQMKFPYLVPGGYYQQLWDWDSMMTGIALLDFGSAPYLAGSMLNFLERVNLKTGMVKGCVTPHGASPAIYHAKPVVIQGAWIAAKATGNYSQFQPYLSQMRALDDYWERTSRDALTGLYCWHDQMESGCDNLLTSVCPSKYGSGPPLNQQCWIDSDAYTLASTDIMTFLYREKLALRNFLRKFGDTAGAHSANASANSLKVAMNAHLWDEAVGVYIAVNTSSSSSNTSSSKIHARTHLIGFPVFAGRDLVSVVQANRSFAALSKPDMMSAYGIRSASSSNPQYTNKDYITPYSNWRGPIWINTNLLIAYGMASLGFKAQALDLAARIVTLLANGIRKNPKLAAKGQAWRECYSSDDGSDLAAQGFLNWNTLAGSVLGNIRNGENPFDLGE